MIVVVVECFAAGELGREYGLVVHQPGKQRDGACIYPTALAAPFLLMSVFCDNNSIVIAFFLFFFF